jgi:hypothetical protein
MKTGGRNAMAGPVVPLTIIRQNRSIPDYFDGKLLIFEWMRMVRLITMI